MKATRTCSVDGCERTERLRRGWCSIHYTAWWKYGDPLASRKVVRGTCKMPDCDRPNFSLGYCEMHYTRVRTHGDPNIVLPSWHEAGPDHPRRQEVVKYSASHARVKRIRGAARQYPCAHCGAQALDWAYDHADPDELIDTDHGKRLPHSLDPEHYLPLCRTCHRRFDLEHLRSADDEVPLKIGVDESPQAAGPRADATAPEGRSGPLARLDEAAWEPVLGIDRATA